MLSVWAAFAEFERSLVRERQPEGIALAQQRPGRAVAADRRARFTWSRSCYLGTPSLLGSLYAGILLFAAFHRRSPGSFDVYAGGAAGGDRVTSQDGVKDAFVVAPGLLKSAGYLQRGFHSLDKYLLKHPLGAD